MSTADTPLLARLVERIRRSGPITVAEYMETALYDSEGGYYATAARRSGRDGDFYTSVDAGPLFGEVLARQLDEMWEALRTRGARQLTLVEAGAGDGRLARDVLDAAARSQPELYDVLTVKLVERSATARSRHAAMLRAHAGKYVGSGATLPAGVTGVIVANELVDALPVHVVVGTKRGVHEIYVGETDGQLTEVEGPPAPGVAEYLSRERIAISDGVRAEVGVRASEWIAEAAAALAAGFLLLFDYGLPASELYSDTRTSGTLTSFRRHTSDPAAWLRNPGGVDITAFVNLTGIARAAERAGLTSLGTTNQTYFLLALGIAERLPGGADPAALAARLSAKTLLIPGGLGSTIKVLAFAKGVGRPTLRGFSSPRLT